MFKRADLIWIAVLAIATIAIGRLIWGFDWGTTLIAAVLVSLGRLAYAWYAARSWR